MKRQFDTVDFRITIEEVSSFKFIATLWDKKTSYEFDQQVFDFETFSGACDHALDLMFKYMVKS